MQLSHISKFSAVAVGSVCFSTLLLSTGCGDGRPSRVPVSGSVTVDGEALQHGSVTFLPMDKGGESRAGGGSLDSDGQFKVSSYSPNDGLMCGKYQVFISGVETINERTERWHSPKVYSSPATSGLEAEITQATDALDFELSWSEDDAHSKPFVERF